MATRTAKTAAPVEEATPAPIFLEGLSAKLMELRQIMAGYSWDKDGKNRHQGYAYITEAQYKTKFQAALLQAGLDFKFDALDYQFIAAISDKMHMVIVRYEARIIDPITGDERVYTVYGSGADNGDKAVYKAETGALKFFLAANFLVAENMDPENDVAETVKEKSTFKTPEQKAEIKAKITDQSAAATAEQMEFIADGLAALKEVDKDLADSLAEALTDGMTKDDAEAMIEAIGGALA